MQMFVSSSPQVSVLNAVEACAVAGPTDCSRVVEQLVGKWSKVVEVESHEGSLCAAMTLLGKWLSRAMGESMHTM